MKPKLQMLWHGGSQAVIAACSAIVLLKNWPTQWEWLVIGVTGALACIKGIDTLLTTYNNQEKKA